VINFDSNRVVLDIYKVFGDVLRVVCVCAFMPLQEHGKNLVRIITVLSIQSCCVAQLFLQFILKISSCGG